jgi:hypothetical protein
MSTTPTMKWEAKHVSAGFVRQLPPIIRGCATSGKLVEYRIQLLAPQALPNPLQ